MKNDPLVSGEAYLKARAKRDLEEIAKYVHPEVHFIGPMTEIAGVEKVLQSTQRIYGLLKTLQVRSRFASGDQVIFTYDFVCADPIGVCRTAELLTFKDGLIIKIEVFFDPRPFEKFMQSQKSISQPV
jgi:SnoaL-like domain